MTILNYALLKDNKVTNTVVIDSENNEILETIIEEQSADSAVLIPDNTLWAIHIGAEYDGEFFIITEKRTSPYESWNWNKETGEWNSPTPYPNDDNNYYWNETSLSWDIQ
jgi:hypothetical protein